MPYRMTPSVRHRAIEVDYYYYYYYYYYTLLSATHIYLSQCGSPECMEENDIENESKNVQLNISSLKTNKAQKSNYTQVSK